MSFSRLPRKCFECEHSAPFGTPEHRRVSFSRQIVFAQTSPRAKNNLRVFGPNLHGLYFRAIRMSRVRGILCVCELHLLLYFLSVFRPVLYFCSCVCSCCMFVRKHLCISVCISGCNLGWGSGPPREPPETPPRLFSPDLHAQETSKPRLAKEGPSPRKEPSGLSWPGQALRASGQGTTNCSQDVRRNLL